MSRITIAILTVLAAAASCVAAFSPVATHGTAFTVNKARFVAAAVPLSRGYSFSLHMSEDESEKEPPKTGDFYDDEVEPPAKEPISDSMRARLIAEASTGLDPDAKQSNVLLYIMGAVAVLALLGGQGIFY